MPKRLRVLGVATVLLAGMLGTPTAASAARSECFGEPATKVGTRGDDTIKGTNGHDVIVARGGNDRVRGRGGEDFICGGAGRDSLFGQRGGEFLFGGAGNDKLYGGLGPFSEFAPGSGDDLVVGSTAEDLVHFIKAKRPVTASLVTGTARGQGTDTLKRADGLVGGRFGDTLIGNAADNLLVGRAGDDDLRGARGFDWIAGQRGDDSISGGAAFDIADYYDENLHAGLSTAGPITVDLAAGIATGEGSDTLNSIEGATGSDGDDTMIGDERDNAFFLLVDGDDTVTAGGGNDFIDAGRGADNIDGGAGVDTLGMFEGRRGGPRRVGVTVDLSTNTTSDGDTLSSLESTAGTIADDTLSGDGGSNGLFSFDGDDTVAAGGGDDLVDPGNGTDTAQGGAGVDLLGNLDHYAGGMTIDLSDNSDSDGDTLGDFEDVLGTFFADTLIGSDGPNALSGFRGNDDLSGLAGADMLAGDHGIDSGDGGAGIDRCATEQQQNCEFAWARPASASVGPGITNVYPWRDTLAKFLPGRFAVRSE